MLECWSIGFRNPSLQSPLFNSPFSDRRGDLRPGDQVFSPTF